MNKLIFVYNADSGYLNVALDMAHKIFSPATYPCSLCDLTYGIFKIRPEWEDFIQNSPLPFEFLHKDEFLKDYPNHASTILPTVLAEENGKLEVFIPADQLQKLKSIGELKALILRALMVHLPKTDTPPLNLD